MDAAETGMKPALLLVISLLASAAGPATGSFSEDFEHGVRLGGAPWALAQQIDGRISLAAAPGRRGRALLATTGPKRGDRVAKADLVARVALMPVGTQVAIAFDIRIPAGRPRNSLQLVDVECASCGEGGNPGIRLYLRNGRLRVDRAKIGIRRAWTRDDAPALVADHWHRITWQLRLDPGEAGYTRVLLDGREVLAARGATLAPLSRIGADRIQIGITANSNPEPATAYFDDVSVAIER
jgi:hypothetical protein